MSNERIDMTALQRVLGEELRWARTKRGWSRRELQNQLGSTVSMQALATYEDGTRQCSVMRLVELCSAMDVRPQDLLGRVHDRLFTDDHARHVRLDLNRVIQDQQPELLPLRRWARDRLRHLELTDSTTVRLDMPALERMAELCGVDTGELIGRLHRLSADQLAGEV